MIFRLTPFIILALHGSVGFGYARQWRPVPVDSVLGDATLADTVTWLQPREPVQCTIGCWPESGEGHATAEDWNITRNPRSSLRNRVVYPDRIKFMRNGHSFHHSPTFKTRKYGQRHKDTAGIPIGPGSRV